MILTMNKLLGFESSGNSRSLSKSFSLSMPFGRSKQPGQEEPKKMTLSQIKLSVELCIQDVQGHEVERLRFKIRTVRDVRELWMLRSDVHQVISRHQNQQTAATAINALLPCFAGWMPANQLLKI
jgi:hypothetical protein